MSLERPTRNNDRYPPVYDDRLYQRTRFWSDYSEFVSNFKEHPLDRKFIDWLVQQNAKIEYNPLLDEGLGYYIWISRLIAISPHGSEETQNRTLAHELIHAAIPIYDYPLGSNFNKIVEEIAGDYAVNDDFINYAKAKIPSYCRILKKDNVLK